MGADHMLFGSDYPHAEGLEVPTDFIYDIPTSPMPKPGP